MVEPGAAHRRAQLEVRLERRDDPLEGMQVRAVVRDELLGGLWLRLAGRGALFEPPGSGGNVEDADVELVDDESPARLDQLPEPVAGLLERVDVVEGDDGDCGRERARGLVEIGEGDGR